MCVVCGFLATLTHKYKFIRNKKKKECYLEIWWNVKSWRPQRWPSIWKMCVVWNFMFCLWYLFHIYIFLFASNYSSFPQMKVNVLVYRLLRFFEICCLVFGNKFIEIVSIGRSIDSFTEFNLTKLWNYWHWLIWR